MNKNRKKSLPTSPAGQKLSGLKPRRTYDPRPSMTSGEYREMTRAFPVKPLIPLPPANREHSTG